MPRKCSAFLFVTKLARFEVYMSAQVLGGSYLGRYVSERTVQYVGGSLFLLFAAATVVDVVRGLQP